jgi:predicted O-linked N-acetylglucosamine transferase (SPINDLY family)
MNSIKGKLPISDEISLAIIKQYKSFIHSTANKDLSSLQKLCEINLFKNLKDSLQEENKNLFVNSISDSQVEVKCESMKLSINFGATLDRNFNKNLVPISQQNNQFASMIKSLPLSNFSNQGMEFNFYSKKSENTFAPNINVLRLIMNLKTNYIVSPEKISDANMFEDHSIIFESEFKNVFTMFKIFDLNLLSKVNNPMVTSLLSMKTDDNFNFIFSDFDNFMNGNKLV